MTHTPGPWRFNGNWLEPVDGGELILAYTSADDGLHGTDDDKALLAAAPDLLAALEGLRHLRRETEMTYEDAYDSMFKSGGRDAWQALDAAIAKARNTPALHVEVL